MWSSKKKKRMRRGGIWQKKVLRKSMIVYEKRGLTRQKEEMPQVQSIRNFSQRYEVWHS